MTRTIPLPAFQDNYIWLLAGADDACVVVDPGDAAPVLEAAARGLRPVAVLLTHHHADHVGGVEAVLARFPVPCYGPDDPRIPAAAIRVGDGDRVDVPALGLGFDVIAVPGHTRSHIAFHGGGALFCGDTLFSLGCGRLFEGTPAQMLASLDRLAALPGDTRVCCAHEYTEANGRFARAAEPENAARDERLAEVAARRARGEPSLPSTLAGERACNPFLRVDAPGVLAGLAARLGQAPGDRAEAFAALRAWKDGFAG
ncbi:hydroxyacylglutathione hydrolase [Arenimonas caeni]|uniref:Hydroxyacylglutathione hydrolase n=1 Tax=Arenimonas caeni TaxID=2058085 RepID=A0A2P6MC74_9GAMM|nr:hydroxyacylglutathione hydrolase [Arenimonas caeni]MDY0022259.1 hydroxyacylglutathione hydrolase [Arenimonas caeni]PRH83595.1 hydroxyacylglutathione hydrolase [Arenimonas caeni]